MVLLSQCWEMLFLAILGLPKFGKRCFRCFSVFPTLGNVIFSNFWFSQCWEMQFSLFFSLPNFGKRSFRCFLVFPILGNAVFSVFVVSQHWEDSFYSLSRGLILDERADEALITKTITATPAYPSSVIKGKHVYRWKGRK